MSRPATAGPTMPPSWKIVALRLTALRINVVPTSSPTKLCRAGLSTTTTRPNASAMSSTRTTVRCPVSESVASVVARTQREGLGGQEQGAARVAVGDHAAVQAEQQGRRELQGEGDADRGRAVGELQDEPVLRDPLHPGPGVAKDLRGGEEAVVADGEGCEVDVWAWSSVRADRM